MAIRKVSVKPVTVGRPLAVLAAMKVAESWPPSAPPSVRITVFMPLATPVCWLGTACTIRLPSAAKARPMPTPSRAAAISSCQGSLWARASSAKEAVEKTVPAQQRGARAEPGGDRPGPEAEDRHPDRGRQQVEAGDDDGGAEAEAGAFRQLGELGKDDEGGIEPGAEQEGGGVGGPDAAHAHHRHVDQRFGLRTSTMIQASVKAAPSAKADGLRRPPAPFGRLADREQPPRCRRSSAPPPAS